MSGNKVAFLSVSAVWFSGTVLDTSDISTTRGGSLAMLFTPECLLAHLRNQFCADWTFEPIILGASNLVLKCTGPMDAQGDILMAARKFLSKVQDLTASFPVEGLTRFGQGGHKNFDLSNLRFAVSMVDDQFAENFSELRDGEVCAMSKTKKKKFEQNKIHALSILQARNAYQQYQMPSCVLPHKAPSKEGAYIADDICALDGIHYASEVDHTKNVSASVASRRKFGRDRKKDFYLNILKDADHALKGDLLERLTQLEFSQSLADLELYDIDTENEDIGEASNQPIEKSNLPVNLSGKIAVIHLDGNGFGKILNSRARMVDRQAFSSQMRTLQANMLVELLNWYVPSSSDTHWSKNDLIAPPQKSAETGEVLPARLRIETLLWGGDEMVFAVPAWRAMEIVGVLEAALRKFEIKWSKGPNTKLTHAFGICFADTKTPIRLLARMAGELADTAKGEKQDNRGNFSFNIAVAGIDIADGDIISARSKAFGGMDIDVQTFVADHRNQAGWSEIFTRFMALRRDIGASQIGVMLEFAKSLDLAKIHMCEEAILEKWNAWLDDQLNRISSDKTKGSIEDHFNSPHFSKAGTSGALNAILWHHYLQGFLPSDDGAWRLRKEVVS